MKQRKIDGILFDEKSVKVSGRKVSSPRAGHESDCLGTEVDTGGTVSHSISKKKHIYREDDCPGTVVETGKLRPGVRPAGNTEWEDDCDVGILPHASKTALRDVKQGKR